MPFLDLSDVASQELLPGFHGKMVHSENMTVAYWNVQEGAVLPEHQHVHEQIMSLLEGNFEFTLHGETLELEPGAVVVIPANVPHSGRALTECIIMDSFSPARDDYRVSITDSKAM